MAKLQKTSAVSQSAASEAAVSAERSKQEEIKSVLEQQSIAVQREKDSLFMQVWVWCG